MGCFANSTSIQRKHAVEACVRLGLGHDSVREDHERLVAEQLNETLPVGLDRMPNLEAVGHNAVRIDHDMIMYQLVERRLVQLRQINGSGVVAAQQNTRPELHPLTAEP